MSTGTSDHVTDGPQLVLGPLLRHVDHDSATVWVETTEACEVSLTGPDGVLGKAATFHVSGHHYALVVADDLPAAASLPYTVHLGDRQVWPEEGSTYPASRIRTHGPGPFRVVFGSCRYANPRVVESDPDEAEYAPDALDAFAVSLLDRPEEEWPQALVLLGDQVYADETAKETQTYLSTRRDLSQAPGTQLADFEEYTYIYRQSWLDPDVRWLLSTVPSSMIFDDHDVIDDWNTSEAWKSDILQQKWWDDRISGALASYWVYQHIGNLSPEELREDTTWQEVTRADDAGPLLRRFALDADRAPDGVRWSYWRDWNDARLLMIDSRAGRVLAEDQRSMLDEDEFRWVESELERASADGIEHVLVGTSLPWLMPPTLHHLETWVSQVARHGPTSRRGRIAEKLRQAGDLEHWPAFRESFDRLGRAVVRLARGESGRAPSTVLVLSGDVHHAYVAELDRPGGLTSRVLQLTCSPVHNAVPHPMVQTFKLGWARPAIAVARGLARLAGVPRATAGWHKLAGPYFGNEIAELTLDGPTASLRLHAAVRGDDGTPRLRTAADRRLA